MHDPGRPHNGPPDGKLDMSADEVTCQQFVELVTDYFEGALRHRTLSQVEEHLVMCDWCVTYADQMQVTIGVLNGLKDEIEPPIPDFVLDALRARRESR